MNIQEFINYKSNCIFCARPLNAVLTHISVISDKTINKQILVPLVDNKFVFPMKDVMGVLEISYVSEVSIDDLNIIVDVVTNTAVLNHTLLDYDQNRVQISFLGSMPVFECCCNKCDYYYLSSVLNFGGANYNSIIYNSSGRVNNPNNSNINYPTNIEPLHVPYESFVIGNFAVHNHKDCTIIYSTKDENAKPLKFPPVDFSGMDSERRLTRVQMLVTFN